MVQRLQRIPRCPAHLEGNDLSDGIGVTIYARGQLNVNSRRVRLKAMLHSKNTWRRRQELQYLACPHQVVVPIFGYVSVQSKNTLLRSFKGHAGRFQNQAQLVVSFCLIVW